MDNLTHTLVGLAAARAGLERLSPYATAVCVLAANAPDADIVAGGGLAYLKHHRGITHSIVGTLAIGLALPLVFYLLERIVASVRGAPARARLGGLVLTSMVATATHPLLDWTNSYGLRPFLPWDGRWVYGDLVFIIDPWLWLLPGAACFLLAPQSNWRVALWTVFGVGLAAAILFVPERRGFEVPFASRVLWLVCLASVALARGAGIGERLGRRLATVALALIVVYWGGLALLQRRALERARIYASALASREGASVSEVAATPTLLNPFRWVCLAESDSATYRFELGPWSDSDEEVELLSRYEKPKGLEAEAMVRASEDPRGVVFLDFARFPVWQVWTESEGRTLVRVTDVRFGEPPPAGRRGGGNFSLTIPVQTP